MKHNEKGQTERIVLSDKKTSKVFSVFTTIDINDSIIIYNIILIMTLLL